jgi:membrane protein CcdC involved in cytochrome C biogenesis
VLNPFFSATAKASSVVPTFKHSSLNVINFLSCCRLMFLIYAIIKQKQNDV